MTPVPSSPVALLDQLDELRAKATPGPWHTWRDTSGVPMVCTDDVWIAEPQDNPADAALIVAAVNAVGPLTAAVRAVLELADELERDCAATLDENPSKAAGLLAAADRIRAALSVTP